MEVFDHGGDFFVGLHSGFRRVCTAVFLVKILIRRVVGTYGIFHVEAVFAKDKSVSVFVNDASGIRARVVAVVVVFGLFVIREVLCVAVCVFADNTVKHASGDNCVKHIFVERRAIVCGVGLRNVFIEDRAGSKVAENHRQHAVENEHKSGAEHQACDNLTCGLFSYLFRFVFDVFFGKFKFLHQDDNRPYYRE